MTKCERCGLSFELDTAAWCPYCGHGSPAEKEQREKSGRIESLLQSERDYHFEQDQKFKSELAEAKTKLDERPAGLYFGEYKAAINRADKAEFGLAAKEKELAELKDALKWERVAFNERRTRLDEANRIIERLQKRREDFLDTTQHPHEYDDAEIDFARDCLEIFDSILRAEMSTGKKP